MHNHGVFARTGCVVLLISFAVVRHAAGQDSPPPESHQHHAAAGSLFASRDASGTSWVPDATPMYGFQREANGWEVMLHGNGFVQFLYEAAPEHRGAAQGGSINWVMLAGRRSLATGRFGLRSMVSLEPVTIPGCGYPNLLATGELCEGDNIHDRQHPHDLFMELAAEFDRPFTPSLRWQLYAGLAGEPALGPPGFPHRLSAMPNPVSPIAHHWLDSTHVTFGVVTTGLYTARWKAEASLFNGREPDEQRFDLDLAPLDSVSGRLWLLPTESVALQVSAGHLNDAELGHSATRVDVDRLTASATYHRRFGGHLWATTVGWGINREERVATHGITGESSATFSNRHTWFSRVEVNGKPAHDLHIHESTQVFTVGKVQAGYTRHLDPRHGLIPGIGASLSAAFVPEALKPRYGGVGLGMGVFLNLRPEAHEMTTP